jgi:FAD dependent oxidoreductase
VVGGGVSGVSAAIASARAGANTLLIERYGALGGNLTIGLLEASMSFHDRDGKQLIGGIPDEIISRLAREGGSPGHVEDDFGYAGTVTPYDPEELKMVCLEMVQEAGARLLLHTWVVDAVVQDARLVGLIIENKSRRQGVAAEVFVDCSGDADVAALAGVEFSVGRAADGVTQPMSILFKLGNVDVHGVLSYVLPILRTSRRSERLLSACAPRATCTFGALERFWKLDMRRASSLSSAVRCTCLSIARGAK